MRTGEKTKSLVRDSDRLYRAKVKHYGLRTGTRQGSSPARLACTAGISEGVPRRRARLCGATTVPGFSVLHDSKTGMLRQPALGGRQQH